MAIEFINKSGEFELVQYTDGTQILQDENGKFLQTRLEEMDKALRLIDEARREMRARALQDNALHARELHRRNAASWATDAEVVDWLRGQTESSACSVSGRPTEGHTDYKKRIKRGCHLGLFTDWNRT